MPEEIMIVLIVFFMFVALPLGITKMALNHKQKRMELESRGGDSSLTESELKGLIKSAVNEATFDINKRLDLIQEELDEVVIQKLKVDSESVESEIRKSVGKRVR